MSAPRSAEKQPGQPQILAGATYRMMRLHHGVTLRQMAEMVGISAGHLSHVENGGRVASLTLHHRIVTVLAALPPKEEK